jgi:hypothetical protein
MWAKYHRRQARTLVNLARLTRDPDTAASWKRLAVRHAEMADRAEELSPSDANSAPGPCGPGRTVQQCVSSGGHGKTISPQPTA